MSHAEAGAAFVTLVEIMARLRGPDGCAWDRAQTLRSLSRYVLEEAAEVVDAIERDDPEGLREEVGDLLFEGVFLSQVSADQGGFDVAAALRTVSDKLVRRHPHVFPAPTPANPSRPDEDGPGTPVPLSPEQVKAQWDVIKQREKAEAGRMPRHVLDGIPLAEPALSRARALCARVATVGFDWPTAESVLEKLDEETREVRAAMASGDRNAIEDEIGDMLFVIANLARKLDVDAETALRRANLKFIRRFAAVETRLQAAGLSLTDATLAQMEQAWQATKRDEPSSR
ncbi:MAG: nucleoside triphosphate pyrophosphohydrolase [Acidobacteria bacterium]|nr:nucleoside triphosphate pyrophosphohydrolase [Acidobacteriota bacterium]